MSDLNIYDHIFFDLFISSQAVSDFLFSKYSVNQGIQVIQVIQVRHVIHVIHVIHEIHIIRVLRVIHSMQVQQVSSDANNESITSNSINESNATLGVPMQSWGITLQTSYVEGRWHQN